VNQQNEAKVFAGQVLMCLWQERTCLSIGKSKEDPRASAQPKRQKTKNNKHTVL
jgi:hypothetical protein